MYCIVRIYAKPIIHFFQPEVDIQLSVAKPLLSDQELHDCNLVSITVETLYSLPDGLTQPQPGATIVSYSAALPLPVAQDVCILEIL